MQCIHYGGRHARDHVTKRLLIKDTNDQVKPRKSRLMDGWPAECVVQRLRVHYKPVVTARSPAKESAVMNVRGGSRPPRIINNVTENHMLTACTINNYMCVCEF